MEVINNTGQSIGVAVFGERVEINEVKPIHIQRMPILKDLNKDVYYFGLGDQMLEILVGPNFDNSEIRVKLVESRINELVMEGKAKLMDSVTPEEIKAQGMETPQLKALAEEVFSLPYQEQE